MSIQALTYVLEHCEARGSDRCIMFAIANHANERGENCWASVATLAHEARLELRTAKYALKRLRGEEVDGRVHYETPLLESYGRSPAGTNFLRIPALADRTNQLPLLGQRASADSAPGVQITAAGGAAHCKQGVQPTAPKPLVNRKGTEPPLTPPQAGGNRKRDRERSSAELEAWAAEHFPAYDPRAVAHAMEWASRRRGGGEVTVETVAAELERMPIEPIAEAA